MFCRALKNFPASNEMLMIIIIIIIIITIIQINLTLIYKKPLTNVISGIVSSRLA